MAPAPSLVRSLLLGSCPRVTPALPPWAPSGRPWVTFIPDRSQRIPERDNAVSLSPVVWIRSRGAGQPRCLSCDICSSRGLVSVTECVAGPRGWLSSGPALSHVRGPAFEPKAIEQVERERRAGQDPRAAPRLLPTPTRTSRSWALPGAAGGRGAEGTRTGVSAAGPSVSSFPTVQDPLRPRPDFVSVILYFLIKQALQVVEASSVHGPRPTAPGCSLPRPPAPGFARDAAVRLHPPLTLST